MGVILGRLAGRQHDVAASESRCLEARLQRREPARRDIGIGHDEGAGAGRKLGQPLAGMGDEIRADEDVIGAVAKGDADAGRGGGQDGCGHVGGELSLLGQMAFERRENFGDDGLVGRVARDDGEIGLGIDGIAVFDQLAHHAFRVRALQQRTGGALADAAHQHVEIGLEPERDGMVADQPARLRLDERAAAGGDDALALADQPRQHPPLAVAEIGFAMGGEDFGDGHAMGGFDLVIRIDEGQAEPLRETPADRGLARSHHADEN